MSNRYLTSKSFQLSIIKKQKENIKYLEKEIPLDSYDSKGFDRLVSNWASLYYGLFFLDYFKLKKILCIDIGVYKGLYSSVYSRHFEKVHSFEASPYAYLHAKANFKRQQIPNITLHEIGLLDYNGTGTLYQKFNDNKKLYIRGTTSFDKDVYPTYNDPTSIIEVPVQTLDSFNLNPSFIKIDVEATELRVLKGAINTISKNLPFLQIETAVANKEKINKFLTKLGYCQLDLKSFNYIFKSIESIEDSYYIHKNTLKNVKQNYKTNFM